VEETVKNTALENFEKEQDDTAEIEDGLVEDADSDDRFEREMGRFESDAKNANKTTQGSDQEEGLTRTKLTNRDYAKRARSAKPSKDKYGITVPKPFEFDVRDKFKTKTIRERKVEEMVKEKELEELSRKNHQFRHKPIPVEVLVPKYNSIMKAEEERRAKVRAQSIQITKNREKPFKFWERELQRIEEKKKAIKKAEEESLPKHQFKANPIPRACSVLIFDKKIKEEELNRAERIRRAAELAHSKAQMPSSMQKYAD
jgi:hypothetical protein